MIDAVDSRDGIALLVVEASRERRPADIMPGIYLWKRNQVLAEARLLEPLPTRAIIPWASFVPGHSLIPNILVAGPDPERVGQGILSVKTLAGSLLATRPYVGSIFSVNEERLQFLDKVPGSAESDIGITSTTLPHDKLDNWSDEQYEYRPTWPTKPSIVNASNAPFSGGAIALDARRIFAVSRDLSGPILLSICLSENRIPVSLEKISLKSAAKITLNNGVGANAIINTYDLLNKEQSYLLTYDPSSDHAGLNGGCEPIRVHLQKLPSGSSKTPNSFHLTTVRSAATVDGDLVPYAVISAPSAHGPMLVRAYGALGITVDEFALTEFERTWLKRGGQLVIPTIHGDQRFPPWQSSNRSDYKTAAAKDLNGVVEDLIMRGNAVPGDIYLLGASAGAFTVAKAALTRPDLFSAVILLSGVLDLDVQSRTDDGLMAGEIGPPVGGFIKWYAAAPSSHRCNAVRFFMYSGDSDPVVRFENSVNFAGYLKALGYKGSYTQITHGDHDVGATSVVKDAIFQDLDNWDLERKKCSESAVVNGGGLSQRRRVVYLINRAHAQLESLEHANVINSTNAP